MLRQRARGTFCAAFLAAAVAFAAVPAHGEDGAPCDEFARAAGATLTAPNGSDANFEAKFKTQTETGQKGLECAKHLTERFKTLRTSSDPAIAEKVLDEYTDVYKKLLNGIEGDGMLLEEANLFLNVINTRIKEAESRSPEAVKEEEGRKQRLSEEIDTIVKFKTDLDKHLIDIISKKKDISFYIRGKQIDSAIEMFGKFNDGLSQSVNEMSRTLQTQSPPKPQPTGSF